jgi:serine/threonine protein kinase
MVLATLKSDFRFINFDVEDESAELGSGTFGTVYQGVREAHKGPKREWPDSPVAVKIPKNPTPDLLSQRDFLKELELMASVNHPACLSIMAWDFDKEGRFRYATQKMKYSLKWVLDSERKSLAPTDWSTTSKSLIALGVAEALAYLHFNGIVHGDIKPGNILLDDEFKPHISDFGLSIYMAKPDLQSDNMSGTPLYMAPELISDGARSPKVDVYAYAILLYELATGTPPYQGLRDLPSFFDHVLHGMRPDLSLPGITPELAVLLPQCWDADPAKRPDFSTIIRTPEDLTLEGCDPVTFNAYLVELPKEESWSMV